jgi:hypothetical protein
MFILLLAILFLFLGAFVLVMNPHQVDKPDTSKKTGDEKKAEQEPTEAITEKSQIAQQTRVLKQCYLLDRLIDLIDYRYSTKADPADRAWPDYNNFSTITAPPGPTLSKLVGSDKAQPIFDIESHQLALMVPRVRFFKVLSGKEGPTGEVEFPFGAYSKAPNAIKSGVAGVEDISRPQSGKGARAGIQSFSYELAGTNPAEAENLIQATAVFYFATLDDLFAEQRANGSNVISFSDLIVYNNRKEGNEEYDDEYFEIRALVGWSYPKISDRKLLSSELKEALASAQTSLLLNLVGHELNFNQDGSVTLEVTYNARLEGALAGADLDILWTPENAVVSNLRERTAAGRQRSIALAKIESDISAARRYMEATDAERAGLPKPSGNTAVIIEEAKKKGLENRATAENRINTVSTDLLNPVGTAYAAGQLLTRDEKDWQLSGLDTAAESNKKEQKKLDEEISQLEADAKKEESLQLIKRYRRVLEALENSGRIFTMRVDKNQLGIFKEGQLFGTTKEAVQNRVDPKTPAKIEKAKGDPQADTALKDATKNTTDDGKVNFQEIVLVKDDTTSSTEDGKVRIPFFYFGDLIDAMMNVLRAEYGGQKNKKAIKTLNRIDFIMGSTVFTRRDPKTKKKISFTVNLANIPISLDLFKIWFQDNVVRTQTARYTLITIFKDVLAQLVLSALGDGCFGAVEQNTVPGILPVTTPLAKGGKPRIPKQGARCRTISPNIPHLPESSRMPAQKLQNIVYFFAREDQIDYLTGQQSDNQSQGIYHLKIGRNKGLIKNVQFTKTDFPFQREARIVSQAEEINDDGYLREKYDANITMVGNTLFHPGQMIYIDPRVPGATKNQARVLGFSGYYFVHEVSHTVSNEFYQTEIKAIHQGFATDGPSKTPRTYPPDGYNCKGQQFRKSAGKISKLDSARDDALAAASKRLFRAMTEKLNKPGDGQQ